MEERAENNAEEVKQAPLPSNRVFLPLEWPQRLLGSLFILALIVGMAVVVITIKESLVSKQFESIQKDFYTFTSKIGFTIDEIIIEGRKRTNSVDLLKAIGLSRKDNIFEVDVHALQKRVQQLPWVRKAIVRKSFLPNVIMVSIQEKEVQSLWQISEQFHPIDEEGRVIEADYIPDKPVLLIVGNGAPENINALLNIIKKDTKIFERVKVANYISQRRWNLVLDDVRNGITIKLPEINVDEAWKKLIKLNTTKGILKRKLTIIDLRFKGRIGIKLRKTPENTDIKLNNSVEKNI